MRIGAIPLVRISDSLVLAEQFGGSCQCGPVHRNRKVESERVRREAEGSDTAPGSGRHSQVQLPAARCSSALAAGLSHAAAAFPFIRPGGGVVRAFLRCRLGFVDVALHLLPRRVRPAIPGACVVLGRNYVRAEHGILLRARTCQAQPSRVVRARPWGSERAPERRCRTWHRRHAAGHLSSSALSRRTG